MKLIESFWSNQKRVILMKNDASWPQSILSFFCFFAVFRKNAFSSSFLPNPEFFFCFNFPADRIYDHKSMILFPFEFSLVFQKCRIEKSKICVPRNDVVLCCLVFRDFFCDCKVSFRIARPWNWSAEIFLIRMLKTPDQWLVFDTDPKR